MSTTLSSPPYASASSTSSTTSELQVRTWSSTRVATPPHSSTGVQFPSSSLDHDHTQSILRRAASPARPLPPHLVSRNVRLSARSALSSDTASSLDTEYTGPIIPPNSDRGFNRTLVICFDGTGDCFDMDNSNVIQFFSVLKKGDKKRQLVYYQSGIGTYTIPQIATPMYSKMNKMLDLMFANNLNFHVMSGYEFLMQNYKAGDKICIFGFSRGAYTARALAGMIHKVGLLPSWNVQQVPFAYRMFMRDNELGWKQSVLFKKTFSIDVDIEFVGVWDTVASVGLLPTFLPFTKSNTAIKTFRHALSLDEHRVKFMPSLYTRITEEEAKRGDFTPPPMGRTRTFGKGKNKDSTSSRGRKEKKEVTRENTKEVKESLGKTVTEEKRVLKKTTTVTRSTSASVSAPASASSPSPVDKRASTSSAPAGEMRRSGSSSRTRAMLGSIKGSIKRSARDVMPTPLKDVVARVSQLSEHEKEELSPDSERDKLEQMYLDRSRPTDVLEVWFAGAHCDIGGGSVANGTPHSLARIPLRWMIRQCFLAHTGIQFEADRLRDLGLDPKSLYPKVVVPAAMKPNPVLVPSPPILNHIPDRVGDKAHLSTPVSDTIGNTEPGNEEEYGSRTKVTEMSEEISEKPRMGKVVSEVMAVDAVEKRMHNISTDGTLVNGETGDDDGDNKSDVVHAGAASVIEEADEGSFQSKHGEKRDADAASQKSSLMSEDEDDEYDLPEADQNVLDALSPLYDQLQVNKYWWILEYIPMRERVQRPDGTWKKRWCMNRGRARQVPQDEPLKVHSSVKMRIEAKDLKYKPRLQFKKDPVWVD